LKESYVSIYREKKAFENLKSIQKSQYDLEKLKEDQKIIDEIGMQKHTVS
jgi:flagellar export protein FliJ